MRIVVDKLPRNCGECIFAQHYGFHRECTLTSHEFKRYDTDDEDTLCRYDYTPCEQCPLVDISSIIMEVKK